ncbi:DUF4902 domain-containing protein [Variovorax sp. JS1663]|uniref:DUF4902 domain-containing protein n=1 Tax=Variovorax sp. JS1663 TaxID=1851577 RepID=UPI000B347468|nr:DUF4902 domain-containing protein [Variovorax sp. JS1663]
MRHPAFGAPRSLDGLLRLSAPALQTLQLTHLVSGIYEEHSSPTLQACGRPTRIAGYTEWIDAAGSPATLGWDWEIRCVPGQVRWHRVGLPFTNLLLVGDDQRDLPWQRSLECLAARVDVMAWAESTCRALHLQYAVLPHRF